MMRKLSLADYLSLDYPVEIRALSPDEGGGWLACIPALGRHSFRATGETREQALQELDAVRRALIDDMHARGEQIPEPDPPEEDFSGNPGIRMPRNLHRLAAQRAREEGVSLNQYLTSLIALGVGGDIARVAGKRPARQVHRTSHTGR